MVWNRLWKIPQDVRTVSGDVIAPKAMSEDTRPPVVATFLVFGEVAVLRAQALSPGVDLCGDGAEVALQGLRPPMNGQQTCHC